MITILAKCFALLWISYDLFDLFHKTSENEMAEFIDIFRQSQTEFGNDGIRLLLRGTCLAIALFITYGLLIGK